MNWHGIIAYEGTQTTTVDSRQIMAGALTSRGLPMPVMVMKEPLSGHQGATPVGTLSHWARIPDPSNPDSTWIHAAGRIDDEGAARALVDAGRLACGVDLTNIEYDVDASDVVMVFTSAELMGLTIYHFEDPRPAFRQAHIVPA